MRLFPLLALLILGALALWWFQNTPPERVARVLKRAMLWLGGGLLVILAATGRLPSLFALIGAAAPFVQRLMRLLQLVPLLQRVRILWRQRQGAAGAAGASSEVRTRYLRMTLDHASGAMAGEVLAGRYAGRLLADLSLNELLQLLRECRQDDGQSAAILEAYLDREHGADWRDQAPAGGAGGDTAAPSTGPMTRDEAYRILGLEPDADRQAIIDAHRRLMQRLHPDRGGSGWLAAKINQAKDLLLGD